MSLNARSILFPPRIFDIFFFSSKTCFSPPYFRTSTSRLLTGFLSILSSSDILVFPIPSCPYISYYILSNQCPSLSFSSSYYLNYVYAFLSKQFNSRRAEPILPIKSLSSLSPFCYSLPHFPLCTLLLTSYFRLSTLCLKIYCSIPSI